VASLGFLLKVIAIYLAAQLVFVLAFGGIGGDRLTPKVSRSVFVSLFNHILFGIAAVVGIGQALDAAKINTQGAVWIVPVSLFAGFFLFVLLDIGTKFARRKTPGLLIDLQELGIFPAFPPYISIPALINFFLAKPVGEELFFRGFVLGIVGSEVGPWPALGISVVLENLRYPQLAWAWRSTTRALILGALFFSGPSVLLPISVSVAAHIFQGMIQIGRVGRAVKTTGKLPGDMTATDGFSGNAQDSSTTGKRK
jgi:membrane protease YdiL (CAAX protease family)